MNGTFNTATAYVTVTVLPAPSEEESPWKFTKTEVAQGEEFEMTMAMPAEVVASSLGFKVEFDNEVFEILEIPTTQWTDMQPSLDGCNNAGNVMISWCDPTFEANTTIAKDTVLLTIKFKAKADAALGDSTFTVSDWNVTGAFDEETYMMKDITPSPEIMGSTTDITVVA